MLAQICTRGHAEVLSRRSSARSSAPAPETSASAHCVAAFSSFAGHTLGRVMQYELRGLENDRFREVAALRRRFEELIVREIRAGVEAGEFTVGDVEATGVAILSLGIDVARWYGAMSDQISPDDVAELHRALVMRMLGAPAS